MSLKQVLPMLWVESIERSVEYYQQSLGFDLQFAMNGDGGAMLHASVINGDVALMLGYKSETPGAVPGFHGGGAELYITLDDVDAYYDSVRAAGAAISQELADQYWGDRTFTVTDPDGYVLTFAQNVRAFDPALVPGAAAAAV